MFCRGGSNCRGASRRARPSTSCRSRNPPVSKTFRSREAGYRSEEHTSELQSRRDLVCRLLLEKKKKRNKYKVVKSKKQDKNINKIIDQIKSQKRLEELIV